MSTNPQTSYDRIVRIIKKGQSPVEGPMVHALHRRKVQ